MTEIQRLRQNTIKAFFFDRIGGADIKILLDYFTDDVIIIDHNETSYKGKEEIQVYFRNIPLRKTTPCCIHKITHKSETDICAIVLKWYEYTVIFHFANESTLIKKIVVID